MTIRNLPHRPPSPLWDSLNASGSCSGTTGAELVSFRDAAGSLRPLLTKMTKDDDMIELTPTQIRGLKLAKDR